MKNIVTRRDALVGLGALSFGVVVFASPVLAEVKVMSAPDAKKGAENKSLVLVDIRHPTEWKETGIASSAHPISMHQEGFLAKLDKLIGGDKSKKIAMICATGARSAYIQKELSKRGYGNVISVAEGMVGGPNGKGWIPRGLPTKKVLAGAN